MTKAVDLSWSHLRKYMNIYYIIVRGSIADRPDPKLFVGFGTGTDQMVRIRPQKIIK